MTDHTAWYLARALMIRYNDSNGFRIVCVIHFDVFVTARVDVHDIFCCITIDHSWRCWHEILIVGHRMLLDNGDETHFHKRRRWALLHLNRSRHDHAPVVQIPKSIRLGAVSVADQHAAVGLVVPLRAVLLSTWTNPRAPKTQRSCRSGFEPVSTSYDDILGLAVFRTRLVTCAAVITASPHHA